VTHILHKKQSISGVYVLRVSSFVKAHPMLRPFILPRLYYCSSHWKFFPKSAIL